MIRNQEAVEHLLARRRGKLNERRGREAEDAVGLRLKLLGFACIQRITTPKRSFVRDGKIKTQYTKRVSGDYRATLPPSGTSVHVECKRTEDNLRFSAFEAHQIAALNEHHHAGGLSLVAWIHQIEIMILRWPMAALVAGRGVTVEQGRALALRAEGRER